MWALKGLGVLIAMSVITVISYKIAYPTYTYRYRLSLGIEADGQVHHGSSVIEISWPRQPIPPGSVQAEIGGQAALVDLGSRGAVVASLFNGESYGPAPDG